jgi:hypothetical protein
MLLKFPFSAPEKWSYTYEHPMNGNVGRARDDRDAMAVGWEQVTVPAGTFWAIRLEEHGWRNNLSPNVSSYARGATRLEFTFWYSPMTRSFVKSERKRFISVTGGSSLADVMITEQLVRFASAESKASAASAASK